jgi:hypothetical protein
MTCHELQDFLDHSLPDERAAAVLDEAHQHAATCPACVAALADLLWLEEGLTRLSGLAAEEPLTQAVMGRIGALSTSPARKRVNGDMLGGFLMAAGVLILALVYGWTATWGDALAQFLHPSLGGSWAALTASGGIEILLAMLVGALLIALGLSCASSHAADAPA